MANTQTVVVPPPLGINVRPLLLLLGVALAVAAGVTVVLWWKGPDWSLLYANLSDSDASSVVQSLQAGGIQYKIDNASGAIMVPAERVHDARLQLASQGLPQGKNSSFEMISKDPGFGVSQFMENARYQYALENELARTISSLQAVEAARVHLAIPQQSAFVRDRRPASASVLLQLRAGHRLEPEQVSAIVHLVASSIPELNSDQVTVVDQQGRLLSSPKSGDAAIAAEQFEAAHRVEDTYMQRIEELIAPIVGDGKVRAQVTVDLDAAASEEAHEQYKPDGSVVRSEHTAEESSRGGGASGGVPGALTNQPPVGGQAVPATAKPPATPPPANGAAGNNKNAAAAQADAAAAAAAAAAANVPESTSKENTRNYEIDRTVSYSHQPAGRIKRVTVAVLVDNVRTVAADGKVTQQPLSKQQIDDITRLVKNAVGFDEARGDSVNVVNQSFQDQSSPPIKPEPVPLWQRPMVRDVTRLVLGALVLVALALGVLRPLIKNLANHAVVATGPALAAPAGSEGQERPAAAAGAPATPALAYEQQLVQARSLVSQDPKRVAQVVKTWVGEGS
jgi:flagellar M-ring protein FliF